jgi:vacuolar-type H+-ATPase subunit H
MKENIIPKKVRPNEKGRESRSKIIDEAKMEVMKNFSKVVEYAKKLGPEIDKHNKKVIAAFEAKLENIKKKGQPISADALNSMMNETFVAQRFAHKEAFYSILDDYMKPYPIPCLPDIDSLSKYQLRPGEIVEFNGVCFGSSLGKVMYEITPSGGTVELEVSSWTNTRVVAALSVYINGLRPYFGKIWLKRGDGKTSNIWPMQFIPLYRKYTGTWSRNLEGGWHGKSENGKAFEDKQLNDADFSIFLVESNHSGDGWSELRYPFAGGQIVEQGYHIGVAAFNNANTNIFWSMKGPVGITPPTSGPHWFDSGENV